MGTSEATPLPDVGGWFRTAVGHVPGAPRIRSWEPLGGFGKQSTPGEVDAAAEALRGVATMLLTGAGVSTASGLPDYRGRDATVRNPMTYQEFVGSDLARRRYWARSTVGWLAFSAAQPNESHRRIVELADAVPVTALVTQNVDQLHQKAGSRDVVELHGSLSGASCLACGAKMDRDRMQAAVLDLNPDWAARLPELAAQAATAPDGDAEVDRTDSFQYPDCPHCGGILKPDVVFFGENARPEVVRSAFDALDRAEALLVLGSSLTVMSGLRFVRRAAKEGKRVVIVNDGDTRGDALATHRIHGQLSDVLATFCHRLSTQAP